MCWVDELERELSERSSEQAEWRRTGGPGAGVVGGDVAMVGVRMKLVFCPEHERIASAHRRSFRACTRVCKCSGAVACGQKEDRREEEAKREAPPRRRSRTPSALALHGFEVRAPYRRGSSWPVGTKRGACGTTDSHVVPHRSTEVACSGLTSQIGRDTVRFTEYGRRRRIKHARKYERQPSTQKFRSSRFRLARKRKSGEKVERGVSAAGWRGGLRGENGRGAVETNQ